jgi:hypothetical protein
VLSLKHLTLMKAYLITIISITALFACSRPTKDLASVEIGMSKSQVQAIVGEPEKKDVINKTEVWNFTDSSRTVVFRADTVYAIMTSPQARLDSIASWVGKTNEKVKKGFGNIGDKIENAADKVEDKLDKDSTKSK